MTRKVRILKVTRIKRKWVLLQAHFTFAVAQLGLTVLHYCKPTTSDGIPATLQYLIQENISLFISLSRVTHNAVVSGWYYYHLLGPTNYSQVVQAGEAGWSLDDSRNIGVAILHVKILAAIKSETFFHVLFLYVEWRNFNQNIARIICRGYGRNKHVQMLPKAGLTS